MPDNELHLDEYCIISKENYDENTLLYNVEPINTPSNCPFCNGSVTKNGTIERLMRDLPAFGKNIWIKILSNRYLCKTCKKSFTLSFNSISDKAKITNRLKNKIEIDSLRLSATEIANQYGLSVTSISNICSNYIDMIDSQREIYAPRVIGIDEVHLNKTMRCVLVDIEEHGIMDILENRNITTVEKYLDSLPDNDNIQIVTMDMWRGYKSAVENCLPNAKIVIDKFHVVKEVINAMEQERKKISNNLNDKKERIFLKNSRWLMLRNNEYLSKEQKMQINSLFRQYPELEIPYALKEKFREIYNLHTRKEAEQAYDSWVMQTDKKYISFNNVIKTVNNWHTEIFNYFDYKYTNGVTEALNNTIKSVEKLGKGYSFKILRGKVLYGTPATKISKKSMIKKNKNSSNKNTPKIYCDYVFKDIIIEPTPKRVLSDIQVLKRYIDTILNKKEREDVKNDEIKPNNIDN